MSIIPAGMSPQRAQAQLANSNRQYPIALAEIPRDAWPPRSRNDDRLFKVWRSRDFLVQGYVEAGGVIRLSVNRTCIDMKTARWRDGITWDELQRLKYEAGYGDACAVEVFPPAADIVNVANVRHLWVLPTAPAFVWHREARA